MSVRLAQEFLEEALRSFNEQLAGEGENYSPALDALLLQGQRSHCKQGIPSVRDLMTLALLLGRCLYWEEYYPVKEAIPPERLDSILRRKVGEEFFQVWPPKGQLFRRTAADEVRAIFADRFLSHGG